jgi:hypothetical protein
MQLHVTQFFDFTSLNDNGCFVTTPYYCILARYNIGRSVEDRQVANRIKINQVMLK